LFIIKYIDIGIIEPEK